VIIPLLLLTLLLCIEHINKNGGTATTTFSNIINEGYKRYSVSAKLNSDPTKNWSVSNEGNVAKWDKTNTKIDGSSGSEAMNWTNAQNACKNSGGRLPTIEELKALWNVHGHTPSGYSSYYWSSSDWPYASTWAWFISGYYGNINYHFKADSTISPKLVSCVR
jgi:hypothetical protein